MEAIAEGDHFSSAAPSVTVEGAGAVPPAGTLVCHTYVRSSPYTGGAPMVREIVIPNVLIVAPAGNSIKLQLNILGASAATAHAFGYLLGGA